MTIYNLGQILFVTVVARETRLLISSEDQYTFPKLTMFGIKQKHTYIHAYRIFIILHTVDWKDLYRIGLQPGLVLRVVDVPIVNEK